MKKFYIIFAFLYLLFVILMFRQKNINNEVLPTSKNVYHPFECSLSVVSVNSLAAMEITDIKPGYVSRTDCSIHYESENSVGLYFCRTE